MKPQPTKTATFLTRLLARILSIGLALSIMMPMNLWTPRVYGYASDANGFRHSTFHRDLTRILAHGAGIKDADKLAVITEAVDSGSYSEYGFGICLNNVKRIDPVNTKMESAFYYHWARRSTLAEIGYPSLLSEDFPAGSYASTTVQWTTDTCDYFNSRNAPGDKPFLCTSGLYAVPCKTRGEVDTLRLWAIEHQQDAMLPGNGGPQIIPQYAELQKKKCQTDNYRTVNVQAMEGLDRLVAMGIFIHALGDSYSHEYCMGESCAGGTCVRTHPAPFCKNNPASGSCTAPWHVAQEFGKGDASKVTKKAALAIWKAVKEYCSSGGQCSEKPPWQDEDAEAFINHFVFDTCSGYERVKYADYVLKDTQAYDKYPFHPCRNRKGNASGSRKKRGRAMT